MNNPKTRKLLANKMRSKTERTSRSSQNKHPRVGSAKARRNRKARHVICGNSRGLTRRPTMCLIQLPRQGRRQLQKTLGKRGVLYRTSTYMNRVPRRAARERAARAAAKEAEQEETKSAEQGETKEEDQAASCAASQAASNAESDVASEVSSPVASGVTSPVASDVSSPVASDVASPVESSAASPVVSTPAPVPVSLLTKEAPKNDATASPQTAENATKLQEGDDKKAE